MARPRTYRNMAAKWWKDATQYPEDWKKPCEGQMEMFDDVSESVADDRPDTQASRSGSATSP